MARISGSSFSICAIAAALLPAILGGFKKQAQGNAAGAGGLDAMLGGLGGVLQNLFGEGLHEDDFQVSEM